MATNKVYKGINSLKLSITVANVGNVNLEDARITFSLLGTGAGYPSNKVVQTGALNVGIQAATNVTWNIADVQALTDENDLDIKIAVDAKYQGNWYANVDTFTSADKVDIITPLTSINIDEASLAVQVL